MSNPEYNTNERHDDGSTGHYSEAPFVLVGEGSYDPATGELTMRHSDGTTGHYSPHPKHSEWVATVPSVPGQPADHYEGPEHGSSPTSCAGRYSDCQHNDPTDDTYLSPNDPTDDDWATGGNTPEDEKRMAAERVPASQTYQEYAND